MKIGILTFHWGTNYGAVLQAYALQKYLQIRGHDVEIINYAPHSFRDTIFKCFISKNPFVIFDNLIDYIKEKKIKKFRNNYLRQTQRYYTPEQLLNNLPAMDVYIAGSDQVWNPYGLKNNRYLYFLPFTKEGVIKISFAASFGVTDYPSKLILNIGQLLKNFDGISVRETSGLHILDKVGIKGGTVMPDPTLLLNKNEYTKIIEGRYDRQKYDYFFYVLQKNQRTIQQIHSRLKRNYKNKIAHTNKIRFATMGIENWLSHINNSRFVVTNSFHGVVFSIIFHKSFVVLPIEGNLKGMNDRIFTLLKKFDLVNRILMQDDERNIDEILEKEINWNYVDEIKNNSTNEANIFLDKYLK